MNLVKGLIKYSELVFKSYLQDIFKDYLKLDKCYFELRTQSNTTVGSVFFVSLSVVCSQSVAEAKLNRIR